MSRPLAIAITAGAGSLLTTLIAAFLWISGQYASADALATYVSFPLTVAGFVSMAAIPVRSK